MRLAESPVGLLFHVNVVVRAPFLEREGAAEAFDSHTRWIYASAEFIAFCHLCPPPGVNLTKFTYVDVAHNGTSEYFRTRLGEARHLRDPVAEPAIDHKRVEARLKVPT